MIICPKLENHSLDRPNGPEAFPLDNSLIAEIISSFVICASINCLFSFESLSAEGTRKVWQNVGVRLGEESVIKFLTLSEK